MKVAMQSHANNGVMEPSNAVQHFVNVQIHHLVRLQYLFPEINPGALRKVLDLCNGDFIRTIDYFLNVRRKNSMMKQQQQQVSATAGMYETNQLPSFSSLPAPSHNSFFGSTVPFFAPQTINNPANQNLPQSNYQMNQNRARIDSNASNLRNSSMMNNPSFQNQIFSNSNIIPNIQTMPCQSLSNQRTNAMLPPFQSITPLKVTQINSNGAGKQDSNFCTPYNLERAQGIGQTLASVTEQDESGNDQLGGSFNKDAYNTTPEIFSHQQREIWLLQQQKLDESQLLSFLNDVQMQKAEPADSSSTKFCNSLETSLVSKGVENNKLIVNAEQNSEPGIESENRNEIENVSGIDYNFLFDTSNSNNNEKDKNKLVKKSTSAKFAGGKVEKKDPEALATSSTNKKEAKKANGNNSWGFIDETNSSPSNSNLIIDTGTDTDFNTIEEARDKGK
ncbi:hypothetical protein C0J52_00561 [Blattella germanica]|nr:hypothetical protein C0J52_00561 [Blattella germanica]